MVTTRRVLVLALLLCAVTSKPLLASTKTWSGAVDNRWSTVANWNEGLPVDGDDLIFPPTVGTTATSNDLPGLTVNSVTISGNYYTLKGNPVFLSANGKITKATGAKFAEYDIDTTFLGAGSIVTNFGCPGPDATPCIFKIAGNLTLSAGDLLFTSTDPGEFAEIYGVISGSYGVKSDTSSISAHLVGNNTYTGVTDAQIIWIDGSQPASAVNVGTLLGHGVTGPVTVKYSGALRPAGPCYGDCGGGLTLTTGDLKFTHTASFVVINLPAGVTRTKVNGTVDLTNATLTPISQKALVVGESFMIIDNDGSDPVQGTFSGLPEGGTMALGPVTYSITYQGGDGNDVVLTVTATAAKVVGFTGILQPILEGTTGSVVLHRTGDLSGDVTVHFYSSFGSAVAGVDFTAVDTTVTLPSGAASVNVPITTFDDAYYGDDKVFYVFIDTPTGGATLINSSAIVSLTEKSAKPVITINGPAAVEGNSGTVPETFSPTLWPRSLLPVTVDFATADITATAGADYQPKSGTLTFMPGEIYKIVTILVNGDTVAEPPETFAFNLSNPSNATLFGPQGSAIIWDDDAYVGFSSGTFSVTEGGQASITFTRLGDFSFATDLHVISSGGTAFAGTDYVPVDAIVSIPAGTSTGNLMVQTLRDYNAGGDKTVNLQIQSASGASQINGVPATLTIQEDDTPPAVSVNDVTLAEGNSGITNAVFTVTLSSAYSVPVEVGYSTLDIEAVNTSDYVQTQGLLTFDPGKTSATISVPVNGDTTVEGDERFWMILHHLSHAVPGRLQGFGTIVNDDSNFTLSVDPPVRDIHPGDTAQFQITVTTLGAPISNATITCSGAPAGSSCSLSPASVTPGSTFATTTLTVTTTKPTTTSTAVGSLIWVPLSSLTMLCLVVGQRAKIVRVLSTGLLIFCLLILFSCGGAGSSRSRSPENSSTDSGTPLGDALIDVAVTHGAVTHHIFASVNVVQ